MLLKIFGALLFSLLTFYAAVLSEGSLRRRVLEAEGLLLLLRHIRKEIGCFASPLPEIYADFENEALTSIGFLTRLQNEGLRSALALEALSLEDAERQALMRFADALGGSYRADQLLLCDA